MVAGISSGLQVMMRSTAGPISLRGLPARTSTACAGLLLKQRCRRLGSPNPWSA